MSRESEIKYFYEEHMKRAAFLFDNSQGKFISTKDLAKKLNDVNQKELEQELLILSTILGVVKTNKSQDICISTNKISQLARLTKNTTDLKKAVKTLQEEIDNYNENIEIIERIKNMVLKDTGS